MQTQRFVSGVFRPGRACIGARASCIQLRALSLRCQCLHSSRVSDDRLSALPVPAPHRQAFLAGSTTVPSAQSSYATSTRRSVKAAGLGSTVGSVAAAIASGISWWPGWAIAGAIVLGIILGLSISKMAQEYVRKEFDPNKTSLENRELREKVEELQSLIVKLEPLAYKGMRLRFTKGINKAVILGMVDQMLANKEVNIWWLPDELERIIYYNMMTLMLSVLDEVVDGMSINFAGHNVKLQLTYLDVDAGEESRAAVKDAALLQKALQPVPQRSGPVPAAA